MAEVIRRQKAKFRVAITEVETGSIRGFSVANNNNLTLEKLREILEDAVEKYK